MATYRIFLFVLLLLVPGRGSSDVLRQRDPLEELFLGGLADFRAGRYARAAEAFGAVADAPGRNPRTTAACIMAAKAEYRAGRFEAAKRRGTLLLDRYPGSAYAEEASYIVALSEFRLGRYDIAASEIVALLREHPGSPLSVRSKELFGVIVSSRLPMSELKRLTGTALPPGLHTMTSLALARSHVRRGEDSLALEVLDGLRDDPDAAGAQADIASLRGDITAGEKIQIAALLPLMGGRSDSDVGRIGQELLDGVRFALDNFNAGVPKGKQVELLVMDTGRDTAKAALMVRDLAASGRVRAVIGPVFSDVFAGASSAANERHLPIVSPTATADGLASEGPFVFQANPDNTTRGRAMAEYAVNDLRMSSFAILASDDPVGRAHAAAFARTAGDLGATVYCTVYFPPDASDLREQFLEIRRAVMAESSLVRRADILTPAFRPVLEAFAIDSLTAAGDSVAGPYVSVTSLFGVRGYTIAESLGLAIALPDTTAEETDIPLLALDGIFLPLGDPGQLDYIAPQFNYFNIRAQVLGNNEWYDPDRLRDNRESVDGALFVSDSWMDLSDPATARFSSSFRAHTGKQPTKFTLYGYDTMNMLLDQVGGGARTRLEIAGGLADVAGYHGLHSDITLRGGRVNRYLHIVKYSGGVLRRLGAVTAGEP